MSGSRTSLATAGPPARNWLLLSSARSSAASSSASGSAPPSPAESGIVASPRSAASSARAASADLLSPSPRRMARPSALMAQSGAPPAIRRRVRSAAWARVNSCVGERMSIRASCRTRSSMVTSSPASQRLAQASWKWVRLIQPPRDRARPQPFVEPGERVFRSRERS